MRGSHGNLCEKFLDAENSPLLTASTNMGLLFYKLNELNSASNHLGSEEDYQVSERATPRQHLGYSLTGTRLSCACTPAAWKPLDNRYVCVVLSHQVWGNLLYSSRTLMHHWSQPQDKGYAVSPLLLINTHPDDAVRSEKEVSYDSKEGDELTVCRWYYWIPRNPKRINWETKKL